ncbi:MAG: hypothetical protein H6851_20290 [Geminicoccaceae bacterium]|nr:hypothetical protein [Geminicoccaceae bacterium]
MPRALHGRPDLIAARSSQELGLLVDDRRAIFDRFEYGQLGDISAALSRSRRLRMRAVL